MLPAEFLGGGGLALTLIAVGSFADAALSGGHGFGGGGRRRGFLGFGGFGLCKRSGGEQCGGREDAQDDSLHIRAILH